MGNITTPFAKTRNKNSILEDFSVPIDQIRASRIGGPSSSDRSKESPRPGSDEIQSKYGRKRDSFSFLKTSQEFNKKERARSNFITKDYLKKLQSIENPFQEVDIALGTPRVLKKYVFDEMKLGQGKFSEFSLEVVRDENLNDKNKDKDDIMKAFLQHKVQRLQEEKTKQQIAPKELSRSPQKEERTSVNELQMDEISPDKRFNKNSPYGNEVTPLKTASSDDSLNKNSRGTVSRGGLKLESIIEKDEAKANKLLTKKSLKPMKRNIEEKANNLRNPNFERSKSRQQTMQGKAANAKKILLESDDEDGADRMKEIEPLMILAHQNVKPIKYIFNQKYMGEGIKENDEKFLQQRLPNLFKDLNIKPGYNEESPNESPDYKRRSTKMTKDIKSQILNPSLSKVNDVSLIGSPSQEKISKPRRSMKVKITDL